LADITLFPLDRVSLRLLIQQLLLLYKCHLKQIIWRCIS